MKILSLHNVWSFLLAIGILGALYLVMPTTSFAQDNGKLEVSEKRDRAEINTKKIKQSKKRKAKGNPNKGAMKVRKFSPFNWDWSKIMWFKAKKRDYKTNKYKPNKRTKYKQYSNDPNYRSETRAGKSDVKMGDPLIPYDSRVSEKGPLTVKKNKAKNPNLNQGKLKVQVPLMSLNVPEETLSRDKSKKVKPKTGGDKLMISEKSRGERKPFDGKKLNIFEKNDPRDNKMDEGKLMISKSNTERKPYDNGKLEVSEKRSTKRKPFDEEKLMTIKVDKNQPEYDDKKLLTVKKRDVKPAYNNKKLMTVEKSDPRPDYDNKKLMTAERFDPKRKKYDEEKLYTEVPKVDRVSPLGKKLYTIDQRTYPTKTMKDISKDIADYGGDYKIDIKKGKDYHPSSRYLLTDDKTSFVQNINQKFSIFWSRLWNNKDVQPEIVKKKPNKHRRDKNEGMIWDNSVHPDTWRNNSQGPEGTEEESKKQDK